MNNDSLERVKKAQKDGGSWGKTVGIVRKEIFKVFVLVLSLLGQLYPGKEVFFEYWSAKHCP